MEGAMRVDERLCRGCKMCQRYCKFGAISIVDGKAVIDVDKCKGCMLCASGCGFGAIVTE